jgi:hypothetical protein
MGWQLLGFLNEAMRAVTEVGWDDSPNENSNGVRTSPELRPKMVIGADRFGRPLISSERLGFRVEGVLRSAGAIADKPCDVVIMAMLDNEHLRNSVPAKSHIPLSRNFC